MGSSEAAITGLLQTISTYLLCTRAIACSDTDGQEFTRTWWMKAMRVSDGAVILPEAS